MSHLILTFLKLAGILQIGLCIGSLAIPRLMNWNTELSRVSTIIAQMFWTYAGYILMINLSFGLVSLFGAEALMGKTFLSKSICIFIFLYWLARVIIQFFYFDTKSAPQGKMYKAGEIALVTLFVFLTVVYGWASYLNFAS
jgi:anaerobic C4-dicarboxylate transporter